MYLITTKIGNSTFQATLDETGLTEEQIQAKGQALLSPAISMNRAKILLKKQDEIDGRTLKDIISEPLKITWQEILPPEPTEEELKIKVYALDDFSKLTRQELIEQQILTERKLAAIKDTLTALEADEKEKIEKGLKEDKGKK